MTTSITMGAQTLYPQMVLDYRSNRTTGNLLHTILGRSDPDVTLKAAGLRKGALEIWCTGHAQALELEALHALLGVLHLTDTDLPGLNMYYVLDGDIATALDDQTRLRWTVTVGYAEVKV